MSKSNAVSMLLIETAKKSFLLCGEHKLLEREWDSVCSDPIIQSFVNNNAITETTFFKKITRSKPTPDDFENLRSEIRPRLKAIERFDEMKACFHGYEAEVLLYGELCGIISEGIEEIVLEKLEENIQSILNYK